MRRLVAVTVTVAATIALGGWAYAQTQPADPQVNDSPAAAKAGRQRGGLAGLAPQRRLGRPSSDAASALGLKRAIHGELLVGGAQRGYRTVVFDRGRITAVSGDSITLERRDGESVTAKLTDATKFNGTPRDQLKAGDAVTVVQSDGTATRVVSKGARAERKGRRQGAGNDLATLNV